MFIGVVDENNRLIEVKELAPLTEDMNEVYVASEIPKNLFTEKGEPIYGVDEYGTLVRASELMNNFI